MQAQSRSAIVTRELAPFEWLEYAGLLARRNARAVIADVDDDRLLARVQPDAHLAPIGVAQPVAGQFTQQLAEDVRVAADHHRVSGDIGGQMQPAVRGGGLQRRGHADDHVPAVGDPERGADLAGLHPGQVDHLLDG